MIGILLNETIELAYTLGKWTYYGGKWVFEWYYGTSEQTELETKIELLQNDIEELQQKIKDTKS